MAKANIEGKIFVGKSVKSEYLELRLANRHCRRGYSRYWNRARTPSMRTLDD